MSNTDNFNTPGRNSANPPPSQPQRPVRQNPGNITPINPAARPGGNAGNVAPIRRVSSAPMRSERTVQGNGNPPVHRPQPQQEYSLEPNERMMRTKLTEVSSASIKRAEREKNTSSDSDRKTESKKAKKYSGSDEGGNTVVSIIKAVVYIIFVLVVSVFSAIAIIRVGNDVFAFVKSDELVEVTIPEYATLDNVSDVLYKNDIIKYPTVFKLFAVVKHDSGEFLAGNYTVTPMMNYETLLGEFKEKPVSGTVDITIPEGYTTDEMISLFVNEYGIGTREGFVEVIQNHEFDYWFIDELEAGNRLENRMYRLDGYLFPDTYQFYKNSSEVTVIDKLLRRFGQIFTKEYRDQCAALGYSVDEMITLASMIEKEAGSPSEFFTVSSVFHNRLNNKWTFPRMESDATVLYVIAHEKGSRPKTVTPEDLTYNTPYNTYMYEGLPPGPIANPSASAMLAALSPISSDYYYFIANKGITYYSATKSEHDAYIAEFRNSTELQTTGDAPEEGTAPTP